MVTDTLPELPTPHCELIKHIARHPERPMVEIMAPYREYEARLRELFAQHRQNPILDDNHINLVPIFAGDTKLITTRARCFSNESPEEMDSYIMALPEDKRRPHGSPATVSSLSEFQHDFSIFSESSLAEMDWSNVVAAGSSVVNCLLPIPAQFNVSKRKIREYYHEKFCPASDVDLFLYGLTHDQAIDKIKQIEQAIRDAILDEVTVVRTKHTITIVSQYPVRHIQIVLRVYKSVSEILAGFDIDAAGAAYDGNQVYVTPRALGSFITQINHVDLTRRSPSYENRLAKYAQRNFEVYWPELDRSRVDPTIFERSFRRTLGLARLLVLEQLPTTSAREAYHDKRRRERGRPFDHRKRYLFRRKRDSPRANLKDFHEEEIADWQLEDDMSNYHTFTIPYGKWYNARRVEKLCYTRDLLLNAEWNQPKDRQVYLHRHPAFFGRVQDVIEDCCGCCPTPATTKELEVAKKEADIYITGKVSFLIDDPGRQQIGSFRPLSEQDWTDMAYVGNTARLCQSIIEGDAKEVLDWLSQEGADANKRDHTGRTPLHLAIMASTAEIVSCLLQHGARLTARLADGRTALHLAAARGDVEIIRILMAKSVENRGAEEERQARRRETSTVAQTGNLVSDASTREETEAKDDENASRGSDVELAVVDMVEVEAGSVSADCLVKRSNGEANSGNQDSFAPEGSGDEPDYYQIDAVAWDIPYSALHLAIVEGREEAVKVLCQYGADVSLPVKLVDDTSGTTSAILTLALALALPREKAVSMVRVLLAFGATSSQAESGGYTAFLRCVDSGDQALVDTLFDMDKFGVKTALNHLTFIHYHWTTSPIHSAVKHRDETMVPKLLEAGARAHVEFDGWIKSATRSPLYSHEQSLEGLRQSFRNTEQPLITAIRVGNTGAAQMLLEKGADPNTLTKESQCLLTHEHMRSYTKGMSALDLVRDLARVLSEYRGEPHLSCNRDWWSPGIPPSGCQPSLQPGVEEYLQKIPRGTYRHWAVRESLECDDEMHKRRQAIMKPTVRSVGVSEKRATIRKAIAGLEQLEAALIARDAKEFVQLYPDIMTKACPSPSPDRKLGSKYEFELRFESDVYMSEARQNCYVELMEAAWAGDLSRIKSLTLEASGPEKSQPPLKLAITDNLGSSPFSVAFLRGHRDVALAILEIVEAQWSPADGAQSRFRIASDDDEENEENNENGSEDDVPRVVSEPVSENFTIDDIGKVPKRVKSHVTPLEILCKEAPRFEGVGGKRTMFRHVMEIDDVPGLCFLLDTAKHFAGRNPKPDRTESSEVFSFPEADFLWALSQGKSRLLGQIIESTGAGIPLDNMVDKSGAELEQKPRCYQGLTVYGAKRESWAAAANGQHMGRAMTGVTTSPLLHAALGGSAEGVKFFMGDAPRRLYCEFGKSKAALEDPRLRLLHKRPGGFDGFVSRWLGAGSDLVIHCVILSKPTARSQKLLEHLVTEYRDSMETTTTAGDTPLMLACRLGHIAHARLLIDANADQSTRSNSGENLIHAALQGNPTAAQVEPLLKLFDADLRLEMFKQRKSLADDGMTPFHSWVSRVCVPKRDVFRLMRPRSRGQVHTPLPPSGYSNHTQVLEMAKLLLGFSRGHELDMLNGAGDSCLHDAVKEGMLCLVKVLIAFEPRLLLRENAVGHTPADLALHNLQLQVFERPESRYMDQMELEVRVLPEKDPLSFAAKTVFSHKSREEIREMTEALGLSGDYGIDTLGPMLWAMGLEEWVGPEMPVKERRRIVWDLCSTALAKAQGKRRLVSLNEANEVVRRLAETGRDWDCDSGSRGGSDHSHHLGDDNDDDDDDDGFDARDFVAKNLDIKMSGAWLFSKFEKAMLGMPEDEATEEPE